MAEERWTIGRVLDWSAQYLGRRGIATARLDAELLLSEVLACDRLTLYLDFQKPLLPGERDAYRRLLRRRAAREPVQILVGRWGFLGHDLAVEAGVLVPRPETEQLVLRAIDLLTPLCRDRSEVRVLDAGTGCGNIAVSIAHALPQTVVLAVDTSAQAVRLARKNAELTATAERVRVLEANFCRLQVAEEGRFAAVLSNPPYVPTAQLGTLEPEVRDYDPRSALDGGADGMDFLRKIVDVSSRWIEEGGCLVLEVGTGQAGQILERLRAAGFQRRGVDRDLGGHCRVVWGADFAR